MKLGRLNHVGVATPSIEASIAFYREVIGAAVIRVPRNKRLEKPSNNNDNIPL
jgi:catechol 2,3-dioxygenase-like lactoylglutathione lyase family enzyme